MTESASLVASSATVHVSTPPNSSNGVFDQMKLSVSRDAFLARLGVAARGVSTRSSIQTLSGVLIREEGSAVWDVGFCVDVKARGDSIRLGIDIDHAIEQPVLVTRSPGDARELRLVERKQLVAVLEEDDGLLRDLERDGAVLRAVDDGG